MKKKLTDRQFEILAFIQKSTKANGYPPTRMEIGEHFKFGKTAAADHIKCLEKKGWIEIIPIKSRGIRIL